MRKRLSTFISLLLVMSLMFTLASCKDKEKKNDAIKEAITETLDTYFKHLSQNKISKLAKCVHQESYFEEDEYKDLSDILDKYFSRIEYEIVEISPNSAKPKNATAAIELTRIDISKATDSFISALDESSITSGDAKKEILEIISDKKVKTVSDELTIKFYEDEEGWQLLDDSKIYDFLMSDIIDLDTAISGLSETTVPPTTESTTEPTTETTKETTATEAPSSSSEESSVSDVTTSDEPTTTTNDDPDESLPETKPHPGLVKKHIVDMETAMKILKDRGYEIDTESDMDEDGFFTESNDKDFFVMYIQCPDSETLQEDYISELDDLIFGDLYMHMGKVTDQWDKNTHNIYSENNAAYNGSSVDLYVYHDEDALAIVGIEQLPQADPSEDFYIIIEELGLWDFGISID